MADRSEDLYNLAYLDDFFNESNDNNIDSFYCLQPLCVRQGIGETETIKEIKLNSESNINDILSEIGIARGTLYYHFKSKEEVLNALRDKFAKEATSFLNLTNLILYYILILLNILT